jgi:hypothetical protein
VSAGVLCMVASPVRNPCIVGGSGSILVGVQGACQSAHGVSRVMAATIDQACPKCGKVIKAPATLAGKKIRCKGCGQIFLIPAPSRVQATTKAEADAEAKARAKAELNDDVAFYDKNPYGMHAVDLARRCPRCVGEMEEDARICIHCGYDTEKRVKYDSKKVYETTGGDYFWWWLPGILCVLAVVLLIVLDVLYCLFFPKWFVEGWAKLMADAGGSRVQMFRGEADKPWLAYLFHPLLTVWSWVVTAFLVWKSGKFAVKRLILNWRPPEVEKEE